MNKEQTEEKLRMICAKMHEVRAQMQADLMPVFLKDCEDEGFEAALVRSIKDTIHLLLHETYQGKIFELALAEKALIAIVMANGLLHYLDAEKQQQGAKLGRPHLH
ncbi:hypothetical protein [Candidatus Tokpelaia sp.]|uniref:hypothetical protein n=1 Tax=Candidatus Tokpelaia sp. TaxID=2233777 RepID=UPI001239AE07|nr:hypothetical protein [Candidatus Tokpelaia sp.]KAA6405774.1 hypothetical protein DPQ22_02820 [Candidatus Tokpelaia sp.]